MNSTIKSINNYLCATRLKRVCKLNCLIISYEFLFSPQNSQDKLRLNVLQQFVSISVVLKLHSLHLIFAYFLHLGNPMRNLLDVPYEGRSYFDKLFTSCLAANHVVLQFISDHVRDSKNTFPWVSLIRSFKEAFICLMKRRKFNQGRIRKLNDSNYSTTERDWKRKLLQQNWCLKLKSKEVLTFNCLT